MDQQIAAVKAALAAVESAVAQTEAALATAATPQDVIALRAVLVDLRAERAKLQLQLASLEAAAVEVQPLGARARGMAPGPRAGAAPAPRAMAPGARTRMKALEKDLKTALVDRTVAQAALAFANNVVGMAKTVTMIGEGRHPATAAKARKTRTARSRRR